jgi:hypothetical protein
LVGAAVGLRAGAVIGVEPLPFFLVVRLRSVQPDGAVVGESRRVCHLVPVPESGLAGPGVLRAYCGVEISPGSAELLDGLAGMPCELCLAQCGFPIFAMTRLLPLANHSGQSAAGEDQDGWSDRWLPQEVQVTIRFALLVLLEDPARSVSVAELADRLSMPPETINLAMMLLVAAGWVDQEWTTDPAHRAWTECLCRLTDQGATVARRMLARDWTPVMTIIAKQLGLDPTVMTELDQPSNAADPGGRSGTPGAAPTGIHPDPDDTENAGEGR